GLGHVRDREDLPEHAVQPEIPLFRGTRLDKLLERPDLDVEQVGHRHDGLELGEAQNRSIIFTQFQRASPLRTRRTKSGESRISCSTWWDKRVNPRHANAPLRGARGGDPRWPEHESGR